jgi:thiol-disulfide isomerase/thioredoxin
MRRAACRPRAAGAGRPHHIAGSGVHRRAMAARHTLSAFKGRYVLLNLWATWCAPCVRELPALAKLQSAMPPGGLTVVAVNVGRGSPPKRSPS